MALYNYLASSMLAYLFGLASPFNGGGVPIYSPAMMYLALYDPQGFELTGQPGYAREELLSGVWTASTNGTITNGTTITFAAATADWTKEIRSWGLLDSVTGYGLAGDFLDGTYPVKKADMPMFDVGALSITLDGTSISGGFSNYTETKLMDYFFGKASFTPPSDIWVGLLSAFPGDECTNVNCNEVQWAGTSYLRVLTFTATWELGSMMDLWNKAVIQFPLADGAWGMVNHYALFDVWSPNVAGNVLLFGPITPERNVLAGSRPKFEITTAGPPPALGIDMAIVAAGS